MRLLRGLAGAVLWILALLLALVGILVCLTVLLLPVGIPLLGYARRLFATSVKLMLPRAVAHPVKTADKSMHKRGREVNKAVAARTRDVGEMPGRAGKKTKRARKHLPLVS